MKTLCTIFAIVALLSGCATAPPTSAPPSVQRLFAPHESTTLKFGLTPDAAPASHPSTARVVARVAAQDVDAQFYSTLAGCQTVLVGYDADAREAKRWSVGIQSVGGLLGAVALPVAVVKGMANSVITLLGALSGYANTELSVIKNEALDAASLLAARASTMADMRGVLTRYYSARAEAPMSIAKLQALADELKATCVMYYVASPTSQSIDAPPAP